MRERRGTARGTTPERALRAWMDHFGGYVSAKREMAETPPGRLRLRSVTVPGIREQLTTAVQRSSTPVTADRTLRDDVHAEDVVATIVGMFTATSLAGGDEQLERMLDLLIDAVRA